MIDILPKFLIATAGLVFAAVPIDFLTAIEKFGVIGVLAAFCWLLWQRDEKRTAAFEHLFERFLDAQNLTNSELKNQSRLLEERFAEEKRHNKTAEE